MATKQARTKAKTTPKTKVAVRKATVKDLDIAKAPAEKVVGGTYSIVGRCR